MTDLVLHTGQARDSDGTWHATFKIHDVACRYASKADPTALPAALDLWGRDWFRRFLAEDRVTACRVCKPDLSPLTTGG